MAMNGLQRGGVNVRQTDRLSLEMSSASVWNRRVQVKGKT